MEHLKDKFLNEAKEQYMMVFLMPDPGAVQEWEDENFSLSDVEEQMFEAEDFKRVTFEAPNDKAAIRMAQKELKKKDYNNDWREVMAASLYLGDDEDGEIIGTIFTPTYLEMVEVGNEDDD